MTSEANRRLSQTQRLALDLGPLVLFFAVFEFRGIFAATAVFMAAILIALAVGHWFERRVSPIGIFTAILVMVFGGLTLWLKNDVFIKMKPTVLYFFFGALLLGGLAFNRLFIKYAFAQAFDLTEQGWRKLTLRWGIFAFALAALNEIIWRNFSTALWVDFKVWGIMPLFFLFTMAQLPLIQKYQIAEKPE
jgi:intracellular septation protein